jgi:hypothetical protein
MSLRNYTPPVAADKKIKHLFYWYSKEKIHGIAEISVPKQIF